MTRYLKSILMLKSTIVLMLLSVFSISLSVVRTVFTGKPFFLFMIWNLFLAFIPWFLASIIHVLKIKNKVILILIVLIWIIFFPNAPYVLTDLIHLGKEKSVPLWYDLILLLSYGFTGLLYGFVGLVMLEMKLRENYRKLICDIVTSLMIYLSCFGIYIGRFLRWNTWDIVMNVEEVVADMYKRIANPLEHQATWVFTMLFGTLLNLVYYGFKSMNEKSLTTSST